MITSKGLDSSTALEASHKTFSSGGRKLRFMHGLGLWSRLSFLSAFHTAVRAARLEKSFIVIMTANSNEKLIL